MPTVYISIGTNLGNKLKNIKNSLKYLKSIGKILDFSSIFLTSPLENKNQPNFYNCIIKLYTNLSAKSLLKNLKRIEKALGRKKTNKRYQPRIIDLDILFYGKKIIKEKNLIIPHKKINKRKFILWPMAEVAPHFSHPTLHKKIITLKKSFFDKEQKIKLLIKKNLLNKILYFFFFYIFDLNISL